MKLLLLGKYPPIQGGVSGATFSLARDLAIRGHQVSVVTNSEEMEIGFREFFWGDDESQLNARHGQGSVSVFQTQPLTPNSYVPWANPYVSKLAGRSIAIANAQGCDAVVGIYLEPYGVAAALVSMATQKPLVLRHAGSDIGRLSKHQDLAETYRWVLSRADVVVTGSSFGNVYDNLLRLGVAPTQLMSLGAKALPDWFCDSDKILDPIELSDQFAASSVPRQLFPHDFQQVLDTNRKPIRAELPTIGAFGKIGRAKGSFTLVEALEKLASRGYRFNFVTLAGGTSEAVSKYCRAILDSEALRHQTWILPLVALWRVPAFIRACNAIAFLEHDFPIAIHRPRIPREVLATGTCLICSAEVADKQGFRENLVDGKNYVRVDRPNDQTALTAILADVIDNPDRCHSIGKHGQFLSRVIERGLPEMDPLAELIERAASGTLRRDS